MAIRSLLSLVAFTLLLPLSSSGQDATARIEAAMQRARAAGLPVALLQSKVAEGRAKGVAEDRIAAAVEQRLASVTRAREVMRQAPNLQTADLAVGADALEAGVGEPVLATLSQSAAAGQRAVAIAVLTQLVQVGVASDVALDRVRTALQRGPDALQRLAAEATAAHQRRGPPDGVGRGPPSGDHPGRGRGPPASTPAQGNPPGAGRPGPPVGRGRGPPANPPGPPGNPPGPPGNPPGNPPGPPGGT